MWPALGLCYSHRVTGLETGVWGQQAHSSARPSHWPGLSLRRFSLDTSLGRKCACLWLLKARNCHPWGGGKGLDLTSSLSYWEFSFCDNSLNISWRRHHILWTGLHSSAWLVNWNWILEQRIRDKLVPVFLTTLQDEPYGFPDQSTNCVLTPTDCSTILMRTLSSTAFWAFPICSSSPSGIHSSSWFKERTRLHSGLHLPWLLQDSIFD